MDVVGRTFVGFAVNKLLDEVLNAFKLLKNCSANLRQLQNVLERLHPSVRELSSVQDEKDLVGKWLAKLREQLKKSLELVHGYGNSNSKINIVQLYRTSKESLEVYEVIQALLREASVLQWASGLSFQSIWLENNHKMWEEIRAGMTVIQEEFLRHGRPLTANSPNDLRRAMSQFFAEDFSPETSGPWSSSAAPIEMLNADSACDVQNSNLTFGQAIADKLINRLLSRDCKQLVGVWGMGGIGKTFTARKVYEDSKIQQHFSGGTYWLTVSKDPNHLFPQLLRKTGISSYDRKSFNAVRAHLKALLDRDRILLVLDDVWKKDIIDYLDIVPNTTKNVILVTTRDQEIFRNVIDSLDMFEIPRLSPEDSWQLFSYHAFYARGKMTIPRELEAVARCVAEECCNLPLALEVIGSTMGNKRLLPAERALGRTLLNVWEAALKRLGSVNHEKNEYEVLYKKLQLSVDSLSEQDFRLQDCFFYFAAFLEDENVQVQQLVSMWVAEGLVEEDVNTSLSGEEVGRLLLMCLVAKSMIEVTQGGHCCKIHGVMRDLVHLNLKWDFATEKQIQASARTSLYAPGLRESKLPEEWTTSTTPSSAKRLSFRDNELQQFPDPQQFEAPHLQVLILSSNESLKSLSIRFFQSLPNLKVLDLSRTGIEKIPGALLQRLTSLALLNLSWCTQLQEVDKLDSLRSLEVFHFAGCGKLKKLPPVNNLTKLKCYAGEMMREEDEMTVSNNGLRYYWQNCRPWQSHSGQSRRGQRYTFPSELRSLVLTQGKQYLIDVSGLHFLETIAAIETSYPAGINKLHRLKILELTGCHGHGSPVRDVSSLGLLEELRMRSVTSFPAGMTQLHRLKILSLRDCNGAPVPALGQLPLLEELSMEFNHSDGLQSYGYEGAFPSLRVFQIWCGLYVDMFVFHPGTMAQIESLNIWMRKREHFPASVTELLTLKRFEVHLNSPREEDSFRDDIEQVFTQPNCLPNLEFLSIKGSFGVGRVRKRLELEATKWAEHILERQKQGTLALDIDSPEN